jgi:PAS domain S-box-containing protein
MQSGSRTNLAKTMRIDVLPGIKPGDSDGASPAWQVSGSRDTGRFRRRRAARARSEDYNKLIESVYDAVLITNDEGGLVDFNSRVGDFFRCTEEVLSRTNVLNLISGANERLLEAIHGNLNDHRYTLIEARCIRYDGTSFPAEVAVNRVDLDPEGQLCFFIRDVTVRKRAQDALEEAVARLEEHDRARSLFVSNVSHELRTPLTSMTYALANMLRGVVGPISEDTRKYLEMLSGDCQRLVNTVSDILDIRQIENQTLFLSRTVVPVASLVRSTMAALRIQAERKYIHMTTDIGDRAWFIHADAPKMERVLMNVVGNAVKFTPEDGSVTAVVGEDAEHPGNVMICVSDTGIGIPPEAIDKVTLRYFTVGEQPSGSGLGLAIAKEIVELHGGGIAIRSPPPGADRGTAVYISLPAVRPPCILTVDDDENALKVLAYQFGRRGYRVVSTQSVKEAATAMERELPAAVVLDLVMPEADGTELILMMKGGKGTARTPIVVITGANLSRAKAQILQSFSIPVFAKPWDEDELIDKVEEALLSPSGVFRSGGREQVSQRQSDS